jgi:hypothetical protein
LENFKITEEKLFMTVTQTKHSSNSISSALKTNGFRQLLAVGSIAMGVTAAISAAPAQAASLAGSTGGSLSFTGVTSDFYQLFNGTSNDLTTAISPAAFSVIFNNGGANTQVGGVGGAFNTVAGFTPNTPYSVPSQTANFQLVSGTTYKLLNNISFDFGNGTTYNLLSNSRFTGNYTTDLDNADLILGISFNLTSVGANSSYYTNTLGGTTDNTNTASGLGFNFQDEIALTGGTSGVVSSTKAVPEPFTIIGTLVGGTAAFRMRKKLADAVKK